MQRGIESEVDQKIDAGQEEDVEGPVQEVETTEPEADATEASLDDLDRHLSSWRWKGLAFGRIDMDLGGRDFDRSGRYESGEETAQ